MRRGRSSLWEDKKSRFFIPFPASSEWPPTSHDVESAPRSSYFDVVRDSCTGFHQNTEWDFIVWFLASYTFFDVARPEEAKFWSTNLETDYFVSITCSSPIKGTLSLRVKRLTLSACILKKICNVSSYLAPLLQIICSWLIFPLLSQTTRRC